MESLPTALLSFFGNSDGLQARIYYDKYALRNAEGNVVEELPLQMWRRIASEIASVEETEELRKQYSEEFYWLLYNFRMIPGGRIMHAVGNPRNVTALNCYVIPIKDDSIESIFDWMKEAARTYSYGGGVGTDISLLRPKGSPVNNVARTSTGSVSFMDLMSLTTGTIGQAGRRGALMITISDSHPDILDFIKIKRNQDKVRYANISVRISDGLMRAVENDEDWKLFFHNDKVHIEKIVHARELWKELIYGARNHAEPGLIFWDRVKEWSTSEYNSMNVYTVNPCAEICLEPYGCCCLGNINLAQFVPNDFKSELDINSLKIALQLTVRFLDNVLTYNIERHPLFAQRLASIYSRRIGVGFTGLGDMLIKLRYQYDSDEAIEYVDRLFNWIKHTVYNASVNLAIEKKPFLGYSKDHLKSRFIQELDNSVYERIEKFGLRNVALLTVPPVGTGAALAGTTSGIEPIFDLSYTRRSESLSQSSFKIYHPLVQEYMKQYNIRDEKDIPRLFVTAHKINSEMRIRMQAVIQKHIDHSISSTVNLPSSATEEDVSKVYFMAWKYGLKGITVYREGSRENILTSSNGNGNNGFSLCPECKSPLIHENGCSHCNNCGYSICSV
jgi:ribonucleoside-diphosphate reductase alpha chain